VLVCPQTKSGAPLRVIVSERVLQAGKRLRERGALNQKRFEHAIRDACRAAKIPAFTPGRLRHSIATHAINQGADMAAVASFLNHKSARTRARFYATLATPAKVPTLL
jgi:site-specific recombinase XerD